MPRRAPRPVPTMMAAGAARPRAHGQAMISTETAAITAVVMAGTAAVQSWELVGSLPGVVGTSYGVTVMVKLVLFLVLLGFAWVNRYRLAPRLLGPAGEASRPALLRSIAVQTGFGLLVLAAAAVLSSLPPSVHEQPVWPFPQRPSTVALSDPDLHGEVLRGMLELEVGALLLLVGFAAWRRRQTAMGALRRGRGAGRRLRRTVPDLAGASPASTAGLAGSADRPAGRLHRTLSNQRPVG